MNFITMNKNKKNTFNPDDLPQPGVFRKKEIDQYKQPPDSGKPIEDSSDEKSLLPGKDAQKTSKQQGLNEEKSSGNTGAFEGLDGARNID